MNSPIVIINASRSPASHWAPLKKEKNLHLLSPVQLDTLFPVCKYSEWIKEQYDNGLPTEGGVSGETAMQLEQQAIKVITSANASIKDQGCQDIDEDATIDKVLESCAEQVKKLEPVESQSGDTCAICLDTLEPESDIRALACHHVYHSECIVPWLTTRKALCPLCKHDYYQKKQGECSNNNDNDHENNSDISDNDGSNNNSNNNSTQRLDLHTVPRHVLHPRLAADNNPTLMYPWEYPEIRNTGYNTVTGPNGATVRRMIGTTGVSYEPPATPISDDIFLEVKDIVSKFRKARSARRRSSSESGNSRDAVRSNVRNSGIANGNNSDSVLSPVSSGGSSSGSRRVRNRHLGSQENSDLHHKRWKFWK